MLCLQEVKTAFENRVYSGKIYNDDSYFGPVDFLEACYSLLVVEIGVFLEKYNKSLKVNFELVCEFVVKKGTTETTVEIFFPSPMTPLTLSDNFKDWFSENVNGPISTKLQDFQEGESGKALSRILYLGMNVSKFQPTGGSSYIELPRSISARKACINVKNKDEKCFVWSLLSCLYPVEEHAERPTKYRIDQADTLFDLTGINYPTPLSDISKFEKQNQKNNISINVYGLEAGENEEFNVVGPLHYTKSKLSKHVNLLYFTKKDDLNGNSEKEIIHYCWIKNLSRLISSQLSKHNGKKWICDRCLQYFVTEKLLTNHEKDCKLFPAMKIELPEEEEKWLKFKHFTYKERHPFVVYADLEAFTKPIDSCDPDPTTSYNNAYQNHVPCAAGYQVVCSYDESYSFYKSYTKPNVASWFVQKMEDFIRDLEKRYENKKSMILTDEDSENFLNASVCHICNKPLEEDKVRDHCHLSGKYRGAAHNECNLQYQNPYYIPVFFHNLSGYDSHLFVKELGKTEGEINIIPCNEERYISFSKKVGKFQLRFLDSYRFMNSSLEELASYMKPTALQYLKKCFPDGKEFDLLTRKGVFPYDYLTDWDKLAEPNLPSKDSFYSKLKGSGISDEDYAHAQQVWDIFKIQKFQEYMELYLKTDVLLLADIFENFRNVCQKAYGLDPAHYFTTPGLTWDAMLKKTNCKLELLTDYDMLLFFEKAIRGGISQCCNRYSKANNRYMKDFDENQPETFLMYFDACNLYGWAMSQPLPVDGFQWLTQDDINKLSKPQDILSIPQDSPEGYVFEVDLKYPQSLHDTHKDLPFCCENRAPPGSKFKKLLTTLDNKIKYVIHYRNLQQCLGEGLSLEKVHRVVKFRQEPWLKMYIDLNTNMRKEAKTEFEKNFFKLMNNAVFGKSMENIRKHRDIKLVSKWDGRGGCRKLIAKPNFKKIVIFEKNLASVELNKIKIKFHKPIYLGMTILDISKWLMYDFHYNYSIPTFKQNLKLLYMDTDSLIYEIIGHDVYKQMKEDICKFDTSDFPSDNRYEIPQENKKIVGKMKDENAGRLMLEFAGLRAKMYSFTVEGDDSNHSKAKGISGAVTKCLTIEDYKNVLFNKTEIRKKQKTIISKSHEISSVEQNKLALSYKDDKRYLIDGQTNTLPWGHYKIPTE